MNINNSIIWFDIETVPLFSSEEEAKKKHSALYKVFEDKYCNDKADDVSVRDHFNDKASFIAEFSKVVCISVGRYQSIEVKKSTGTEVVQGFKAKSYYGDEKDILEEFSNVLSHETFKSWSLGGHNIKGFDIPYLFKRYIINGMDVPNQLILIGKKPRDVSHVDTMDLWKTTGRQSTGLELMSLTLGIESPKQEISGKDVRVVYYGKHTEEYKRDTISKYCESDVIATYDCYRSILSCLKSDG